MTQAKRKTLKLGIIAGEASGDILGADLIAALKVQVPDLECIGVGGPRMIAQGLESAFPMDRLSVMGLIEPLRRLPELLRMRRYLKRWFLEQECDLVVGIDSPDFTLNIERWLRHRGIKTAHYVSPSVWAWRQKRIFKIARSVDKMLVLFPFEQSIYETHQIPVAFVGHPLADTIAREDQREHARRALNIDADAKVLAIMPGSRGGEVAQLAPRFLETAQWCLKRHPGLQFIIPAASPERAEQIKHLLETQPVELPVRLLNGESQLAMAAADSVLMASGTTTLEAMLLKRPMVVAYRFSALGYAILKRLVSVDHFALPNLLARKRLVPEVLQDDVRADVLGPLVMDQLTNPQTRQLLAEAFDGLHAQLARGAGQRAASELMPLLTGETAKTNDAEVSS